MGELQEASGRSAELRALIYAVRGEQVMLDRDLATLYGVETKALNQAVTRNLDRFPERYSFKLTPEEAEDVRSQIVTLSGEPMRIAWWRYPPRVFTEQGIPVSFPRLRSSRMALGGHELGEAVEGSRLEGGIKAVRVVDNPGLAGIMALDSTGGGGRQARVKPPVVCFRSDFHEPEAAPVVYDLELMGAVAEAAGFADGSAPSSLLVFEKIGYQHASRYSGFLERYRQELGRQLRKGSAEFSDSLEKYGDVPLWLAIEIVSFGTLSKLYENTKSAKIREDISARFGCSSDGFASWTRALSGVRNICAHFGRLIGMRLTVRPKKIAFVEGDNGSPFYVLSGLLVLLSSSRLADHGESDAEAEDIARAVQWLLGEYRDVAERCGVPSTWLDAVAGEDGDGRASESEGRLSALIGAMRGNSVSPPAAGHMPPQRNGGAPATPSGSARGTDRDIPASFPRSGSSRMALVRSRDRP